MKTVLIATANPDNSGQIRTDRFVSIIQKALSDAEKSNDYDIKVVLATDLNNFLLQLEKIKPNILHLVGHGDRLDNFVFESKEGGREFAKPARFAKVLHNYATTLEAVVISACHSQALAQEIVKEIDYASGYDEALEVEIAKDYSYWFYVYLAGGNTYPEIDDKLKDAAELLGIQSSKIPRIFTNKNPKTEEKQTKPNKNMTYEEFKAFADDNPINEVIDFLDNYYEQMGSYKAAYSKIKRESINDTKGIFENELKERLKPIAKKFLA